MLLSKVFSECQKFCTSYSGFKSIMGYFLIYYVQFQDPAIIIKRKLLTYFLIYLNTNVVNKCFQSVKNFVGAIVGFKSIMGYFLIYYVQFQDPAIIIKRKLLTYFLIYIINICK